MDLALLNTSILTADGRYEMKTIDVEGAQWMIKAHLGNGRVVKSYIGHPSTAQILSELLEIEVPVCRELFTQEVEQQALVFKLMGRQTDPTKELTLEEVQTIGYTLKVIDRIA